MTHTCASMPARITRRVPAALSLARTSSAIQQEKLTFGTGWTSGPRASLSSRKVCPRPFGYCSVATTGRRSRRAVAARTLMLRMTSSRWSASMAGKRRSCTSTIRRVVPSRGSVIGCGVAMRISLEPGARPWPCAESPNQEPQIPRSRPRYWTASDTCSRAILSHPDRSAIVRATLSTLSCPRADSPRLLTARPSNRVASWETEQKRRTCRPLIRALTRAPEPASLSAWRRRAASTRPRTAVDDSPAPAASSP